MMWAVAHYLEDLCQVLPKRSLADLLKKAVDEGDEERVKRLLALIPQKKRLMISLELGNETIDKPEEEEDDFPVR